MKRRNLSFTLTLYLLISEIILTTAILILGYRFARDYAYRNLTYKITYQVSALIQPFTNQFNSTVNFIDLLTKPTGHNSVSSDLLTKLDWVMHSNPNILELGVYSRNSEKEGTIIPEYILSRGVDEYRTFDNYSLRKPSDHSWQEIPDNYLGWTPILQDSMSSHYIVSNIRDFTYTNGEIEEEGVLICKFSLNSIIEMLNSIRVKQTGFPVLLSGMGTIIYHPDRENIGQHVDSLKLGIENSSFQFMELLKAKASGYSIVYPSFNKSERSVAVYWPIPSISGSFFVIIPESEFLADMNQMFVLIIIAILAIGGVNALITIYFAVKLVSPVEDLAYGSRQILEEYGIGLGQNRNEIDVLKEGIDLMKNRLETYRNDDLIRSVDRAEINKELILAREIEMGMVPTNFPLYPDRNDFDCYGTLIPAHIVGGDMFDIFLVDNNYLFVVVCDTLGKGIPAAMYSVVTRTLIRKLADSSSKLGAIMEKLNEELYLEKKSDMFVTVFMSRLNLLTGELEYCNAGHQHPLIARVNNGVHELPDGHGIPVGVRKKSKFLDNNVYLNSGDMLVAFTDGIVEETDEIGEFYGTNRLISVVRKNANKSTENVINEVLLSLDGFRSKNDVSDDTTIVAVRYLGE